MDSVSSQSSWLGHGGSGFCRVPYGVSLSAIGITGPSTFSFTVWVATTQPPCFAKFLAITDVLRSVFDLPALWVVTMHVRSPFVRLSPRNNLSAPSFHKVFYKLLFKRLEYRLLTLTQLKHNCSRSLRNPRWEQPQFWSYNCLLIVFRLFSSVLLPCLALHLSLAPANPIYVKSHTSHSTPDTRLLLTSPLPVAVSL